MAKKLYLGEVNVNGILFVAEQETLIKLKLSFKPIIVMADFIYRVERRPSVYVLYEELYPLVTEFFEERQQSVNISKLNAIQGHWAAEDLSRWAKYVKDGIVKKAVARWAENGIWVK